MTADRTGAVVNLDEASRARAAGDLLAELPWDHEQDAAPDPARLSAAQFLGRLVDAAESK